MPDIKISDLNKVRRLSDEALLVIVQDNANKVVTIKELAERINANQNRLITKLHDEIKQSSQGGNVKNLKDIVAKHEYALQNQKRLLNSLMFKVNQMIKKCEEDNEFTRKILVRTNKRIDELNTKIKLLENKLLESENTNEKG